MSAVMHHTDMNQRVVPASKAPPVATRAPSSVFGLASSLDVQAPAQDQGKPATPVAKGQRKPPTQPSRGDRTIALLGERGPMTAAAIGDSLGIDHDRASILLCSLKHRGVGVVGKEGRRMLYGMAAAASTPAPPAATPSAGTAAAPGTPAVAGFKRWLEKNGDASAEGRPVSLLQAKPSGASPTPIPAPAIPSVSPSTSLPASAEPSSLPEPDLICGLFNNGDLVIELGTSRLRLKQRHTRQLVAYLERIGDAALQFEHP